MATNEDPFKEFPKISELAKVLGKTAITSDPTLRQWKRTSLPSIPIKEIYVGNRTYEVNNGFTKKKTMTLDEAIEHCKQKADELSICNKDCSLEHKQLFIWLSELKAIKEKSYEDSMGVINIFTHNTNMKNLWHDINKERIPLNKKVLVEYTFEGGFNYRSLKLPDDNHWLKSFVKEKRIRRWLYVDDLL